MAPLAPAPAPGDPSPMTLSAATPPQGGSTCRGLVSNASGRTSRPFALVTSTVGGTGPAAAAAAGGRNPDAAMERCDAGKGAEGGPAGKLLVSISTGCHDNAADDEAVGKIIPSCCLGNTIP